MGRNPGLGFDGSRQVCSGAPGTQYLGGFSLAWAGISHLQHTQQSIKRAHWQEGENQAEKEEGLCLRGWGLGEGLPATGWLS